MIEFILFDWGGTLGISKTRPTFLYNTSMPKRCKTLQPKLIKTLQYLKSRGYKLGIISNTKHSAYIMKKSLIETGLIKYFDDIFVYSSDYGMCRKPCGKIFKKAIAIIHKNHPWINKNNILYVGNDYEKDVLGANPYMRTAFLTNGDIIEEWKAKIHGKHDCLLNKISDLVKYL